MEEAELGQAAGRAAIQPEAPEWVRQSQLDWFPEELIDKYGGTLYRTRLNGDALDLPADKAEQIAEDLRALGHGRTHRTRRRLIFAGIGLVNRPFKMMCSL